jgi:putative transposase
MRYVQGGGLIDERRVFREKLRMEAAERFHHGDDNVVIAHDLRVSVRSVQRWRKAWSRGGPRALASKGPASLPLPRDDLFAVLERELLKGRRCHVGCWRGMIFGLIMLEEPYVERTPPSYKGHRYPVEVISHCVWLYHRFPLSFGEVEELMLERGVLVSHETVRRWCAKFGQAYANGLRRRQPRPGDKWHLDEVFIKINGRLQYLWRAVDQDGNVLDILVQNRRDKAAAKRFVRRPLTKTRTVPRVIVTDKLRSYGAAHREIVPSVEHRQSKYLNNRAENSHQPTRQRERAMKGFRSVGAAQRFLSAFSGISPHFRPRRHLMNAPDHRIEMTTRFAIRDQITGTVGQPTAA